VVSSVIFSALWNFSNIIISLSWYIKQAKLKGNCSRTLILVELDHSTQKAQLVQANLHQEVVLVEALSTTQVEVHIQILGVPLKAKDLLLQVRGTNLQIHHIAQWDQLPGVVEFNALSVEEVAMSCGRGWRGLRPPLRGVQSA
jgi:hypothetical protein